MGKHKKQNRVSRTSSGNRKASKIKYQIRRLRMKISRWQRYKDEISKNKRPGKISRWDYTGIEKHIEYLQSLIKK